jgi:hypothetical protein
MMGTRLRQYALALSGQVLLLGGLAIVVGSFFWLPLWVSTFCFDTCEPGSSARTVTAWEFALRGFDHWYVTPIPDTLVLIVVYFPLLAGVVMVLCGAIMIAHPSGPLLRWLARIWVAGIALLAALLLLIFFIISQPDMGYWGMALSYVLSGIGILLIRAGHPELRRAK